MSLYERLGVKQEATTEEIRRAYKQLAKEKHPDRGGDPEEFKQIQEAHEVLTDEGRRRMYDMTGSIDGNGGGPHGGMAAGGIPFEFMGGMGPFGMPGVSFDFGSMFGSMFGGGGGGGGPSRTRPGKSPNKHHDIPITLSDFYKGRNITLRFNQARRCDACKGSGAEKSEPCNPCGGRGIRTQTRMIGPGMMAQTQGPCDVCNGEGKRVLRACQACHSKRFKEGEKVHNIEIKPGMSDGQTIILAGECSDTLEYESPGDVVLILKRADPPTNDIDNWEWKGNDLWTRKRITFAESIVGFSKTLDGHPSGKKIVVSWKKGAILHNTILQAPGWGMPKRDGGFGVCFIEIIVDSPPDKEWSEEDRKTLQSLFGSTPEEVTSGDEFINLSRMSV